MFTSRTCVRSRARARGEAPACRMVHARARRARARVKLLYIWHYVSDSIPTKLFWGLTFSSAGGLSEEKYQSQFGNIFPVALFCPPLPFVPPLSSFVYECAQKRTTILKETIINLCMLLHKGSCSSFVIAELLLLIELCGMVMFWNSDSKYLKIMDLQTHSVSHILR